MSGMKKLLFFATLLCVSCGGGQARAKQSTAPVASATPVAPTQYTYKIRAVYPHATDSYTQGLQYADGVLWEGTGQNGASVLQRVDLETGRTHIVARLPRQDFGEGITLLGDKVYQLTWQSNKAYVYDAKSGEKLQEFRYAGEGWGLTTDGVNLYMSDGTEAIQTIDPATFKRGKRIHVTIEGRTLNFLNELEWIEGRIWANVYTTDQIAIINPDTGVVEGVVDLQGLYTEPIASPEEVLNGIAYDAANKRIFVTGKNWSKLFEIEIIAR